MNRAALVTAAFIAAICCRSFAAGLSGSVVEFDPVALPVAQAAQAAASNAQSLAQSKLSPNGDGSALTGITPAQIGAAAAAITNSLGSISFISAPASTNSAGLPGQVAYTTTHFYLCVATNIWKRSTLAGW